MTSKNNNSYFIEKLTTLLLKEQDGKEFERGVQPPQYVSAWVKALHKWWKDNNLPEEPPPEIIEVVKVDVAEGDVKEIIAKINEHQNIPKKALFWCLQCILKMPTSESHLFFEDLPQTIKCIKIFSDNVNANYEGGGGPIFSEQERNIYQYNHKQLEALLTRKGLIRNESSIPPAEVKGYETSGEIVTVPVDDLNVTVIRSLKACKRLGLGSKWCTREDYHGGGVQRMDETSDDPKDWIYQIRSNDGQWIQANFSNRFGGVEMKATYRANGGFEAEVGSDQDASAFNTEFGLNVTEKDRLRFRKKVENAIKVAVAKVKKRAKGEEGKWSDTEEFHSAPSESWMGRHYQDPDADPLQERFNRHLRKVPLYD